MNNSPDPSRRRNREFFTVIAPMLQMMERLIELLPFKLRMWVFEIVRNHPTRVGVAIRYVTLRTISDSCGELVAVFEGVYLRNVAQLRLGNNVSIHPMCYLDASGGLSIGNDVSIAHGVTVMTTEHDYRNSHLRIRDTAVIYQPVFIGNDVWIGAGAKILAGVTIGDRVVIGAGSVVTSDIPSRSVAVGVPARVIKEVP